MRKVLLIGSTGFVGRHIEEALTDSVVLFTTTRQPEQATSSRLYFDFRQPSSWQALFDLAPDVIINAAGYGVVKEETDLELMYDINYRMPAQLLQNLKAHGLTSFWLQVGTAFEYDLSAQQITEQSACTPLTHYGISKFLCSNFLLSNKHSFPFLILRPFAMFGPYESASKLVPYLINAQKYRQAIPLSTGEQQRDYFYVKDLARFVSVVLKKNIADLPAKILNIGSGEPKSLKDLATDLSEIIPGFDPAFWQWDRVPQRANENQVFYNSSTCATAWQLQLTPLKEAFRETVVYYFQ